jgi:ribosomal protein L14E/L6E/L27E
VISKGNVGNPSNPAKAVLSGGDNPTRDATGKYIEEGKIHVEYKSKKYGPYYDFFNYKEGNDVVYKSVESLLKQVLSGYHVAIFGYGYSGSGKSYALLNTSAIPDEDGILIQFIKSLPKDVKDVKDVKVELDDVFELYNAMDVNRENLNITINGPVRHNYKELFSTQNIKGTKESLIQWINQKPDQELAKFKDTREKNKTKTESIKNTASTHITVIKQLFSVDNTLITSDNINIFLKGIELHRRKLGHICPTPNNPDSSRGHLFVRFKITTSTHEGYLTICDMDLNHIG